MWKKLIGEIAAEKQMYGEEINAGASTQEIERFREEVKSQTGSDLPEDWICVLEYINGLEFNGFILYGIDEKLLNTQPEQTVRGMIENNRIWHENEYQKKYLFLAESSISWYVYDPVAEQYFELDKPSGSTVGQYDGFEELLLKMLDDALA